MPIITKVEEWINADAGVGASIASGSHTCQKNCAAFILEHINIKKPSIDKKWYPTPFKNIKWYIK